VYIATIEPTNPRIRQVSESIERVRKDPEPYTGGQRPWVYYTAFRSDGRRVIRRCELGL
jgi:hypothetical protein